MTKLELSFETEERGPSFSPSLICHGWEYALCQYILAAAGELPKPKTNVDKLRPMLGYAFEYAFHLDHPEYEFQVPCCVPCCVDDVPALTGTADFVRITEDTIEVIDTKLVATSVARQIHAGRCWYYELQLMIYGYALQLKYPNKKLVLKLAVCDRNFLNWKFHVVKYDQAAVDDILESYCHLQSAVTNPSKLKKLISIIQPPNHPWMKYSPLGGLREKELRKALEKLAKKGGLL